MKTCTKCKDEKDVSEFSKNKHKRDGFNTWCKKCCSEYGKSLDKDKKDKRNKSVRESERRIKLSNYDKLKEYVKSHPCPCGEDDYVVTEFDHRNRADKKFTISDAVKNGYSWSKILGELVKCDVLCANCHRRKTAKEMGWYK